MNAGLLHSGVRQVGPGENVTVGGFVGGYWTVGEYWGVEGPAEWLVEECVEGGTFLAARPRHLLPQYRNTVVPFLAFGLRPHCSHMGFRCDLVGLRFGVFGCVVGVPGFEAMVFIYQCIVASFR